MIRNYMVKAALLFTIVIICIMLSACPQQPDITGIKNGQNYIRNLEAFFNVSYGINFLREDSPEVTIVYQIT